MEQVNTTLDEFTNAEWDALEYASEAHWECSAMDCDCFARARTCAWSTYAYRMQEFMGHLLPVNYYIPKAGEPF